MKVNIHVQHQIQLVVVKLRSIYVYNVWLNIYLHIEIKNNILSFSFKDGPIVRLNGGGIISENKRLILTCIVDAYPSIDSYQWYKNNEKLNLSSLTSSLIIDNISKNDSGVYICSAKNTLKYSNGTTIEKFDRTQTRVTVECKCSETERK